MKKEAFVIYTRYYDVLKDASIEEFGYIFKAILYYENFGTVIDMPNNLKIAFGFIKNQLDLDREKYEKKIASCKENGKKGGLAKNDNIKKQEKVLANLANAKFAKHNEKENENDKVNEKDNDKVNVNEKVLSLSKVEKEKVSREEREILENYVIKNKLASKNVDAYVSKIISNGDHLAIIEKETKKAVSKPKSQKVVIQEELASIKDKRSCARVLAKYYSKGDFPPAEFDKIAEKYKITCYDELYEYYQKRSKSKSKPPE